MNNKYEKALERICNLQDTLNKLIRENNLLINQIYELRNKDKNKKNLVLRTYYCLHCHKKKLNFKGLCDKCIDRLRKNKDYSWLDDK